MVVSSVSFSSQQIKIKDLANSIYIKLDAEDVTMDEVVVTAMDIKRNPRELGYSVQTVKGSEIQETQR